MGRLTNDMTRLRGEIADSRNKRNAFLSNLRVDVTEMRSNFREDQTKKAEETMAELESFDENLKKDGAINKADRLVFVADLKKDGAKNKADRLAFMSDLKSDLNDVLSFFREDHKKMAEETMAELEAYVENLKKDAIVNKADRLAFIADLKSDLSDMLSIFRENHKKMAEETMVELEAFVEKLKTDGAKNKGDRMAFLADLKSDLSDMLSIFRENHKKITEETMAELAAFVDELKKDGVNKKADRLAFLANLRNTISHMRAEFSDELKSAHQAWFGAAPVKKVVKTKPKPKPVTVEPRLVVEAPPVNVEPQSIVEAPPAEAQPSVEAEPKVIEEPEEELVNDLTLIQGIGKKTQEILNEAGICSFLELAECSPDELHEIESLPRVADVEKWINQAKNLM
ncbi:MAG: DUF4332 domain-containing protein [Candidatus Hatepunaea meridiana]|nr:DUF4332 domain-containing protein [Candidatus Hatepunaea meridiana]